MMGIFRGYIELDQIDFYLEQIKTFGKVNIEDMAVNKTFNTKNNSWHLRTITCQDVDNSIFFKYIAKDNKK